MKILFLSLILSSFLPLGAFASSLVKMECACLCPDDPENVFKVYATGRPPQLRDAMIGKAEQQCIDYGNVFLDADLPCSIDEETCKWVRD